MSSSAQRNSSFSPVAMLVFCRWWPSSSTYSALGKHFKIYDSRFYNASAEWKQLPIKERKWGPFSRSAWFCLSSNLESPERSSNVAQNKDIWNNFGSWEQKKHQLTKLVLTCSDVLHIKRLPAFVFCFPGTFAYVDKNEKKHLEISIFLISYLGCSVYCYYTSSTASTWQN